MFTLKKNSHRFASLPLLLESVRCPKHLKIMCKWPEFTGEASADGIPKHLCEERMEQRSAVCGAEVSQRREPRLEQNPALHASSENRSAPCQVVFLLHIFTPL